MGMLLNIATQAEAVASIGARNASIGPHDDKPLADPAVEARRLRVLDMLDRNPSARYAVLTDTKADPEAVVLALAIRGRATCELLIPRGKYDGPLLLDLIEKHGSTAH
jgi:hypothetical protein